jgi:hypothetical protein
MQNVPNMENPLFFVNSAIPMFIYARKNKTDASNVYVKCIGLEVVPFSVWPLIQNADNAKHNANKKAIG